MPIGIAPGQGWLERGLRLSDRQECRDHFPYTEAAARINRALRPLSPCYENRKAGGLLRYGIPDFKMEKHVIDRRVAQMEAEGVTFHYGVHVGGTSQGAIDPRELLNQYDAVALTGGAEAGRDLPIPGRDLDGIHFAMDFLPQQNRRVSAEPLGDQDILAEGKHSRDRRRRHRFGLSGTSFRRREIRHPSRIHPAPPEHENKGVTWPNWPLKMRTSSSQAEGAKREFAVLTQKFSGVDGKVQKLHCVQVDDKFKPLPGTEFDLDAQLVLLAMGFVHPVHEGMLKTLGVDLDQRGNVRANMQDYIPRCPRFFPPLQRRGHRWWVGDPRGRCARGRSPYLMVTIRCLVRLTPSRGHPRRTVDPDSHYADMYGHRSFPLNFACSDHVTVRGGLSPES